MDPPKSLFSSLSIGRVSRRADPIPHPLLGASTTSLTDDGSGGLTPPADAAPLSAAPAPASLPYKARQRHERGASSVGSVASLGGAAASPVLAPASLAAPPSPTATLSTPAPAPTLALSAAATTAATAGGAGIAGMAGSAGGGGNGASSSSSLGNLQQADETMSAATSKLQLQSLKAAAQRVGLGNGSMGMAMIDAIFEKGLLGRARIGEGGDWGEVLRVLITGKAMLLLPSSPASSLPMTPQTLRDHIAFLSPPVALPVSGDQAAGTVSVLVTLSGLIGTLQGDVITFESTVPADSPLLLALRDASTRTLALSSLRPTALPSAHLPTAQLAPETATLSFPPLGRGPAPAAADARATKDTSKLGRINPFASLFGSASAAPSPPRNAPSTLAPEPTSPRAGAAGNERALAGPSRTSSPRPSLLSLDAADGASIVSEPAADGYAVAAHVVARPVRSAEVHKALSKALRSAVRAELEPHLPDRLVERVLRLVLASTAPAPGAGGDATAALLSRHHAGTSDEADAAALDLTDAAAAGERLQQLMEDVYDELVAHHRGDGAGKRRASSNAWARHDDSDKGKKVDVEKEASDGTERVEALVCRLLYNRIFSPLGSDDARHDEALASRIAALNMLDLSLDHLGLITRPEAETDKGALAAGLAELIDAVGLELQKLASAECLTPKDKADVLVKAHEVVVDGLKKLPPVELRPEGETYTTDPGVSDGLDDLEQPGDDIDGPAAASSPDATPLAAIGDADPMSLSTITEASEKTPMMLDTRGTEQVVPDLVLPDSAEETDIAAAMSESLHDVRTGAGESTVDVDGAAAAHDAAAPSAAPVSAQDLAPAPAKLGSTSGADLILPLIIFAVVKSNPAQLASQLMYLRRFRSAICLSGPASYAIVNLTAVVEFLEHVQLADLGLGHGDRRVMSVADLSPIGLGYLDEGPEAADVASASSRLRGRVLQVGELAGSAAGSAGKVITGVAGAVDSFGSALRGLIAPVPAEDEGAPADAAAGAAGGAAARPGLRPRQASTFSLASVTASVASIAAAATTAAARSRSRASSRASASDFAGPQHQWGGNQEMVAVVSRPGSVRERDPVVGGYSDSEESGSEGEGEGDGEGGEGGEAGLGGADEGAGGEAAPAATPAAERAGLGVGREPHRRATVSGPAGASDDRAERASIGNRLASIGGRGGGRRAPSTSTSPDPPIEPEAKAGLLASLASRAGSSAAAAAAAVAASAASASAHARRPSGALGSPGDSATSLLLAPAPHDPPIERFLTCEVGEIRLHEVGALLRDYRRLANIVAALPAASTPP